MNWILLNERGNYDQPFTYNKSLVSSAYLFKLVMGTQCAYISLTTI